jgi:hypothetical protein
MVCLQFLHAILQPLGLVLVLVSGFTCLVELTGKTLVFAFDALNSGLGI